MNKIFGELCTSEVILIMDPEMGVQLTGYIWVNSDKHVSMYIPELGIAKPCVYCCGNSTRADLIAEGINKMLTAEYEHLFPREQKIIFPQRYISVIDNLDNDVQLASFACEEDAREFQYRHTGTSKTQR